MAPTRWKRTGHRYRWILSVRHPRWILGRLAVLAAEKEVRPGQVEAFASTATALPNVAASFVSNSSHLGSPPGRIPQVPTILKGGCLWNPDTARSIDSTLLHDIFNLFSPLRDLININHKALYIAHSIYRRSFLAFYQVESTPALASRRGAYTPQIAPRWALKVSTWLRPPGGVDLAKKSYRNVP